VPHANQTSELAGDTERERESDAGWAEELALRVLLARVRPERRGEAAERVRSVLQEFETDPPTPRRRLPRVIGSRAAREADRAPARGRRSEQERPES
jgi:hypothetical protein